MILHIPHFEKNVFFRLTTIFVMFMLEWDINETYYHFYHEQKGKLLYNIFYGQTKLWRDITPFSFKRDRKRVQT